MKLEFNHTEQVGSCNNCLGRDRTVVCVALNTINFRLCRECADTLVGSMMRSMGDFGPQPDAGGWTQAVRWSRGIRSSDFATP